MSETSWIEISAATSWLLLSICAALIIGLVLRSRQTDRRFQLLKTVAERSNDGLLLQQMDGTIIWCNQAFCDMFGRDREFWIGEKPQKWVVPSDKRLSDEDAENFRYDLTRSSFEQFTLVEHVRSDGSRFWNQLSLTSVDIGDEEPVVILSSRDVSDQVKREKALTAAKERLELAVNYDSLTGLANRRKLMNFLTETLASERESHDCVGVIAVDLDKFKETNDTHGHAAGDAVLMDAARILGESVSDDCLAARTGGDEFVLVLPHISSHAPMRDVAKHILAEVKNPVLWEDKSLSYGASIGIALSQPGQLDVEELIQKADFALYDAKDRGRGTFSVYDTTLGKEHVTQKGLAEDLAHVIQNNGMKFYFQPIVDVETQSVCGIEALARWEHPKRGVLSPVEFLAMAEDNGLLQNIDMAAMDAAIEAYVGIKEMGFDDIYVSFNVSFQTLSKSDLVDALKWRAAEADIPTGGLAVEVLETVLLVEDADETDVAKHIRELEEAGFHTRLDDFGTGYAGLKHLAQLNARGIKIDRSLVRSILVDETSDIVVRAVLRLARALSMDVVAEGVEDIKIADKLQSYGCNAIQGFVIVQPMPFDDLKQWLIEFEARPYLTKNGTGY